jgi:ElaB/YqjD/DUF883 family membrane-anchored ribosome-binding protein
VGEYAESARTTARQAAESARMTARQASERVRNVAGTASVQARQGWQRASTSVDEWVHEYPLAAGAIAVAVGAAIGLSAPSTEFENRTMGETRDQAIERARTAALDMKDNVTQKAKNVAESVIDVANSGTTPPRTTTSTSSTGSV